MRGFFGIGVEGLSKPMNAGNLFRSAHAFGASFIFTVGAAYRRDEVGRSDTSDTPGEVPLYEFATAREIDLPRGCRLVGVELVEGAEELPSFRHPRQAAYILGPERGKPVGGGSRKLSIDGQNSDQILYKHCHCRRDSHV